MFSIEKVVSFAMFTTAALFVYGIAKEFSTSTTQDIVSVILQQY
jgi:hypothetical protein